MAKSGNGKKARLPRAGKASSAPEASSGAGYCKPPAHTRFRKGVSGNPGGRPKGAKNLKTMICEMADKTVTMSTPEGKFNVTIREAVARKVHEMMLKGDFQVIKAFHVWEREWEAELKVEASREGEREAEKVQQIIKEIFLTSDNEINATPDEDQSD